MFDFKIGKKIKPSKNFNNHKRPKKNNNCFHPLVREQSIYNKFHKKGGFFSSALLSFLLIPGSVTANLDGDFNINGTDIPIIINGSDISIGGLDNSTGILNIHERYGANDTTIIHYEEKLTCKMLNNESSRKLCKEFTAPGYGYSIQYLGKDKPIREYSSNTVYIVPPGKFQFEDVIKITNAKNVAIIGEAEAGLHGEYPTLKGSKKNDTMLKWEDCERCLLANINIDPTTENAHSLPVYVSGRKTEMELRNISANHSRTGLLVVSSANSIILENVGTSFEQENRHKTPSILSSSAISLRNCSKIKAKDVWVHDVFLDSSMPYRNVIDIINPEDINFDGIYIGLTKNSISTQDMAYIGLAFNNMEKYSRAGGSVVNALMKGLHLGVYTGGETLKPVTVPENWPVNRHILNLSERTISPSDITKVTGQVTIETNDDIQLIANKPGVQKVSGEDLFYNLKVIFSGLRSPITNVSTTNSSFIPNSTSNPGFQKQKGGDNSGMSSGEIVGAVAGPVIGLVVVALTGTAVYKNRAAIRAFFAASLGATMSVSYKAAPDRESIVRGQSDDGVYQSPTEVFP
ncbi:hypothetical protein NX722_20225 [Endozoicomonas gorgoniicola]|uniref:Right handed beta helix domain-containing protein n=1 Tax=Endozoicomonas gorgoniicola TaxID=1234144 RepID=A0ABT3MZW3_9GAMM|nr:hypothetical protein [Endozoicomonas gorgoniicola]MCW7554902.1 hypothetical protein [Endozoicomonas gorgoniicola]